MPILQYWHKEFDILFCSITPTNLGQLSKPVSVLKPAGSDDFKTHPTCTIWPADFKSVPGFENWPRFVGVICRAKQNIELFMPVLYKVLSSISLWN